MKIQYTGSSKVIKRICEILNGKVDAVAGKGLSENDFTDEQRDKLANLENYVHPAYTAYASGLYKVAVDAQGHVSAVATVDKSDITTLGIPAQDTTYTNATQTNAGLLSAADKKKLDGIAANANNYTHPTISGNKHIPSGGSSGQILRWSADGTAVWGADKDTTYGAATASAAGLMSAGDKAKLDGIAAGANKTTVDTALSSTSTSPVQNKAVKTALDKTFQLRGWVNETTDWNTVTKAGCYKVQMSSWGDADVYHSPNGFDASLYSFGLLFVMATDVETEHRVSQVYIPHKTSPKIVTRMHNGNDFASGWQAWSSPACTPLSHTHNYLPLSGNAASATKLQTARKINGEAFDGSEDIVIPRSMLWVHSGTGTAGTSGWVKIARFSITGMYKDSPIEIIYTRRSAYPVRLIIRFRNENNSDPALSVFRYDTVGTESSSAALVKSAESTWDLYIKKTEAHDSVSIMDCRRPQNCGGVLINWVNEHAPNPPTGYVMATAYNDSGWQNLISGATGQIRYRKIGKLVEIDGQYKPANSGGGFTIGTLPEGYRPSSFKAVATLPNPTCSAFFQIQVSTDGTLNISGYSASTFAAGTAYSLHLMYFVD